MNEIELIKKIKELDLENYKIDFAKLSDNENAILLILLNKFSKLENELKKYLIAKPNLLKIETENYNISISKPTAGKPKIVFDWQKIYNYAKENKLNYFVKIDEKKTQQTEWFIKDIKQNSNFYSIENGKAYVGAIKITKKESK